MTEGIGNANDRAALRIVKRRCGARYDVGPADGYTIIIAERVVAVVGGELLCGNRWLNDFSPQQTGGRARK